MALHALRVLTLNCWNISSPFDRRMDLVRDEIQRLNPDLIGLQEIIVRLDGFDQAAAILDGLGYDWGFGAAFRWDDANPLLPFDQYGHGFGNVVASRWPLRDLEVRSLPGEETGERRSVSAVRVQSPHGVIPFFSTHLNWKLHHGWVRERQVAAIAEIVSEWSSDSDFPPILVGDMNAEPDSCEVRYLCGLQSLEGRSIYFQDAWRVAGDGGPGFTWDNRNPYAAYAHEPNRRIDYILVGLADANSGRGWVERAALAFGTPTAGVFPSDHFGVVADIRI